MVLHGRAPVTSLSWHMAYLEAVLRSISNVAMHLTDTKPYDLMLLGNAEVISLLGESPYFADADLSKFGYGSKVIVLEISCFACSKSILI